MEQSIMVINGIIADLEVNIAECRKHDELIGETHALQVELFEAVSTVKSMEDILANVEVSEEANELASISGELVELAENMGDSLEDVDALRDAIIEEQAMELNRVDSKLKYAMQYAINCGKEATGKFKRGMMPSQVNQIAKLFALINGFDMLVEQINFIKTLNVRQGNYLIDTLMAYRKQVA